MYRLFNGAPSADQPIGKEMPLAEGDPAGNRRPSLGFARTQHSPGRPLIQVDWGNDSACSMGRSFTFYMCVYVRVYIYIIIIIIYLYASLCIYGNYTYIYIYY